MSTSFFGPQKPTKPATGANITGAKNTTASSFSRTPQQLSAINAGRATTPAPAAADTPVTDPNSFGNFTATPVDNAAPAMTDEDYLGADTMFQAQKNALQAALDAYLSDSAAQRQSYNTNYGESLRKLGFTGDRGALDKAKWDDADQRFEINDAPIAPATWNETDNLTASGRGFENALNDFASRGMLQSSAYGRARNDLMRNLNEQLASTAGSRQTAMGEFDRNEAAKKQEKQTSESQAAQETLARIKAAYGIG
jgi:hypothetical protein